MRYKWIMLKRVHGATVLGAVGLALAATVLACTAGTVGSSSGSSGSTLPQTQAEVTSTAGLVITATISAATLGEECGSSGSLRAPSADCAPSEDGGTCGGTSYCQQSNVQIAFTASTGSKAATVEVVSVTLHDSATGNLVDTLAASKPQSWSGSSYVAWDETIKPGTQLKASYDLTAPKWSTITAAAKGTSAYSTKYKLNVTLRIDGVEVVLQSTDLNREPQVAT